MTSKTIYGTQNRHSFSLTSTCAFAKPLKQRTSWGDFHFLFDTRG